MKTGAYMFTLQLVMHTKTSILYLCTPYFKRDFANDKHREACLKCVVLAKFTPSQFHACYSTSLWLNDEHFAIHLYT
jgi:hypothetical protein